MRRSYARSSDTQQKILAAALDIAAEKGFASVSVAEIANRAGVAVGNVNYHFGSKARLMAELMRDRQADFLSRLAPPSQNDDFFSYERSILSAYLSFLHHEPAYAKLAEEIRYLDPELYRTGLRAHIAEIEKRISSAVDRGELAPRSDAEIRVHAYLIQGAYSFLDRLVDDPDYPGDERALACLEQFLATGLSSGRNPQSRKSA